MDCGCSNDPTATGLGAATGTIGVATSTGAAEATGTATAVGATECPAVTRTVAVAPDCKCDGAIESTGLTDSDEDVELASMRSIGPKR